MKYTVFGQDARSHAAARILELLCDNSDLAGLLTNCAHCTQRYLFMKMLYHDDTPGKIPSEHTIAAG